MKKVSKTSIAERRIPDCTSQASTDAAFQYSMKHFAKKNEINTKIAELEGQVRSCKERLREAKSEKQRADAMTQHFETLNMEQRTLQEKYEERSCSSKAAAHEHPRRDEEGQGG